jgi:hypothetical protein
MSDIPAADTTPNANSESQVKTRSAAALIRQLQGLTPGVDAIRAGFQEIQDVIAIHGELTDEDLAPLGMTAVQVAALLDFLAKFLAFLDASTQSRPSYRSQINAIKRLGVQV